MAAPPAARKRNEASGRLHGSRVLGQSAAKQDKRVPVGGVQAHDVVGQLVELLVVRDRDHLRLLAEAVQQARHALRVVLVERGVDLVHQQHERRPELGDGEQ